MASRTERNKQVEKLEQQSYLTITGKNEKGDYEYLLTDKGWLAIKELGKLPGLGEDLPQYNDDTEIFILMSQEVKSARGFIDFGTNTQFTFAFTSEEKAKEFIKKSKERGFLSDVDLLYRMTVGEFFEWKQTGQTNSELTIDPDPDMVSHSVFNGAADKQN